MEQHDARLQNLLERVRSINLKLNWEKCKFRMDEVMSFNVVSWHG